MDTLAKCVSADRISQTNTLIDQRRRAAFILDKDGELLYRNGDLARWNDDRSLEYI